MPTLTVKQVIQADLLRVCKDATRKLRDKDKKKEKKRKFSQKEIAEMRALIRATGWDDNNTNRWMKINSILHEAPELLDFMLPLELFAVVLVQAGDGQHRYPANKPLIVTSKEGYLWNPSDGGVSNWAFTSKQNPVYATDEQVEQCIKDLTPVQWTKLHAFDVFKPIVDAAMNKSVTVEDAPASDDGGDDNGEIKLPDGRTITMSD